jgi:hypothetical protein
MGTMYLESSAEARNERSAVEEVYILLGSPAETMRSLGGKFKSHGFPGDRAEL